MIDFFEWHGYTPYQRFGQDIIEGQKLLIVMTHASEKKVQKVLDHTQGMQLIFSVAPEMMLQEPHHKATLWQAICHNVLCV